MRCRDVKGGREEGKRNIRDGGEEGGVVGCGVKCEAGEVKAGHGGGQGRGGRDCSLLNVTDFKGQLVGRDLIIIQQRSRGQKLALRPFFFTPPSG